jgi:hypothetical protein
LKKFKIGEIWESVETYRPSVHQNDSIQFKSIVFPISQGDAFLPLENKRRHIHYTLSTLG